LADRRTVLTALCATALAPLARAAAPAFEERKHYAVLPIRQPSQVPAGKVEVTEVFSYGCPACYQFEPTMTQLRAKLPANAQAAYVHASWNKAESWPVFQRAFIAAQLMGFSDRSHTPTFGAIWTDNGPLAVADVKTGRLRPKQPTIEDVGRFYASRKFCDEAEFVKTAKSFAAETKIRQSDALVKAYQVSGTPSLVVGGRYRLEMQAVSSIEQLTALVQFLVQKTAAG
jgi:protein dithiol oxidoreductase (disulfide-forming)